MYHANGYLLTKTEAHGIVATMTYGGLNRVKTKSYSDRTPPITYTYGDPAVASSKGRLTQVVNSVSTTNYLAYDAQGRVTASNQMTEGQTYAFACGYNLAVATALRAPAPTHPSPHRDSLR